MLRFLLSALLLLSAAAYADDYHENPYGTTAEYTAAEPGSYASYANYGKITATGDGGTALNTGQFYSGNYGATIAEGLNGGIGIQVSDNWTNSTSGTGIVTGNGGTGIKVGDTWFSSGAGAVYIAGANSGAGVELAGRWIHSGTGALSVAGKGGTGIRTGDNWTDTSTGFITVSSDLSGTGIAIGGSWEHNGSNTVSVTADNASAGITITGDWVHGAGGAVSVTTDNQSVGVASSNWLKTGGSTVTVTASGGSMGITTGQWDNSGSGAITVTADGSGSTGIYTTGWNNASTITAEGLDGGTGIRADGNWENAGTVTAQGDGGTGVFALGSLNNSGTITTSGTNSGWGIYAMSGVTNGGDILSGANGLMVYDAGFTNASGGALVLSGDGTAASFTSVQTADGSAVLTFAEGSTLALNQGGSILMDYTGTATTGGSVMIEDGAKLTVLDASLLKKNESATYTFIQGADSISGSFTTESNPMIIDYTLTGPGTLTVKRVSYASEHTGSGATSTWLSQLETLNTGNASDSYWSQLLYNIENKTTLGAVAEAANRAHRQFTPQATAQSIAGVANMVRAADRVLADELRDSSRRGSYHHFALWARPFSFRDERKADSDAYSKVKNTTSGLGMGFSYMPGGSFALGAGLTYMNTELKADDYKGETSALRLSAAAGKHFSPTHRIKLWIAANTGFSVHSLDQKRYLSADLTGDVTRSDSNTDLKATAAGMKLGADINALSWLRLSPGAGLDYAIVKNDGYFEDGALGLYVEEGTYSSLESTVDFTAAMSMSFMELALRAAWRHEFLDVSSTFKAIPDGMPEWRFRVESEKRERDITEFGAALRGSFDDKYRFHYILSYDYITGDNYDAQQIAFTIKWFIKGGAY